MYYQKFLKLCFSITFYVLYTSCLKTETASNCVFSIQNESERELNIFFEKGNLPAFLKKVSTVTICNYDLGDEFIKEIFEEIVSMLLERSDLDDYDEAIENLEFTRSSSFRQLEREFSTDNMTEWAIDALSLDCSKEYYKYKSMKEKRIVDLYMLTTFLKEVYCLGEKNNIQNTLSEIYLSRLYELYELYEFYALSGDFTSSKFYYFITREGLRFHLKNLEIPDSCIDDSLQQSLKFKKIVDSCPLNKKFSKVYQKKRNSTIDFEKYINDYDEEEIKTSIARDSSSEDEDEDEDKDNKLSGYRSSSYYDISSVLNITDIRDIPNLYQNEFIYNCPEYSTPKSVSLEDLNNKNFRIIYFKKNYPQLYKHEHDLNLLQFIDYDFLFKVSDVNLIAARNNNIAIMFQHYIYCDSDGSIKFTDYLAYANQCCFITGILVRNILSLTTFLQENKAYKVNKFMKDMNTYIFKMHEYVLKNWPITDIERSNFYEDYIEFLEQKSEMGEYNNRINASIITTITNNKELGEDLFVGAKISTNDVKKFFSSKTEAEIRSGLLITYAMRYIKKFINPKLNSLTNQIANIEVVDFNGFLVQTEGAFKCFLYALFLYRSIRYGVTEAHIHILMPKFNLSNEYIAQDFNLIERVLNRKFELYVREGGENIKI